MNIDVIKKEIEKNIGRNVRVTVYGMRHKIDRYVGTIKGIYPNIFSVVVDGTEKSFPYRDVITGDIKLKYL